MKGPTSSLIASPFSVFISSSQTEFSSFRRNLKEAIDTEEFARQRIMKSILVEEERGAHISEDVQKAGDIASIYVGIIGQRRSDWTKIEFRAAWARGLPILIYEFRRHGQRGMSGMRRFLDDEVKPKDIRIRGPYKTEASLTSAILNDLAIQVTEMVRETARIRKAIHRGIVGPEG